MYNPSVAESDYGEILVIGEPIRAARIVELAADRFGDMVKGVVDIRLHLLALGGGLHSDEEAALMQRGSAQEDLWGINIHPERPRSDWIEFDSIIKLRPRQGNRSRGIEDASIRLLISEIVGSLIL